MIVFTSLFYLKSFFDSTVFVEYDNYAKEKDVGCEEKGGRKRTKKHA